MTSAISGAQTEQDLAPGPLAASESATGRQQSTLTLEDLPPADTVRWVTRRKALVVAGVQAGIITLEEACRRYQLSPEEFQSWQRLIDRHGPSGLRTTRLQDYREQADEHAA